MENSTLNSALNSALNSTLTHVVEKNLDSSNIINQQQLEIASLKQQIVALQAQLQAPAQVAPKPYNSDTDILKLMRDFFRAQKPDGITSTDVLLTIGLMLFKADDHFVKITQPTLADSMACNHQTVARSVKKLTSDTVGFKWLSAKALAGYPTKLTVNPEHLPLAKGALKQPSAEAKKLVVNYTDAIKKYCSYTKTYGSKKTKYGYTRFSPEWTAKQERWAQKMLERYANKAETGLFKGPKDYTYRLLQYARLSPTYTSEFGNGLYNIWKNKKAIEKAFEADTLAKSLSQQQPIVEPAPAPLESLEFTEGEES